MITVEINDQISPQLDRLVREHPRVIAKVMNKSGSQWLTLTKSSRFWRFGARPESPAIPDKLTVRSGNMYRNLNKQVRSDSSGVAIIVGTRVPYARKHEFGEGVRPRPVIGPAMQDVIPVVTKQLNEEILKLFN